MDQATNGRTPAAFATSSDPVQMRAILEHHLRVPGGPPFEVLRCKPSFTRGRGSRGLFQYDVTLRGADGREWNEAVSGVAYGRRRTREAWERLKLADAEGRHEPHIRRAAYVPELDLLLQVFPFDHKLPALGPLMAGPLPGLRAPIMARFGPGDWHLDAWQSQSIRYRVDLRASVKLTVRATESRSGCALDRRFYAKVYPAGNQLERAWTVQQELTAALRVASEPFGLAPVVAYLPDAGILVRDEVQGLSLRHIIRRGDPEKAGDAVRRAAGAIAALHRLPINAPEHRIELDRTDPARLRRATESLRNSRPDLATALAEIETQILSSLDAIGKVPAVPVHGDLKPLHLLFEDERVVLLDFDKFAAGEPMLDVTNMLVLLRREQKTDATLARVFTEEYFAHVPAAWEQRLAPHFAWAMLSEASAFAIGLGKSSAEAKTSRPEKRERNVDILVEDARAILAGRA